MSIDEDEYYEQLVEERNTGRFEGLAEGRARAVALVRTLKGRLGLHSDSQPLDLPTLDAVIERLRSEP